MVNHFEPAGAAALLEEEIREALLGTAGTAAGLNVQMFLSASVMYLCLLAGCIPLLAVGMWFWTDSETLYYTALPSPGKDCHRTHSTSCWNAYLLLLLSCIVINLLLH